MKRCRRTALTQSSTTSVRPPEVICFRSSLETLSTLHKSASPSSVLPRRRLCSPVQQWRMSNHAAGAVPLAATYAYAVAIRRLDTGTVQGVALVVPSGRYLSWLANDAHITTASRLSEEIWREIDEWVADGNARLPARPAPMSRAIVDAFLDGDMASAVSVERFAAIPIAEPSHEALARLADGMLPALLKARRSAA